MPTISEFFGIVIRMYWKDHKPPHFHAIYGEFEAEVDFENLEIINGDLPTVQERMVLEWAELHKEELRENWKLAENTQPLFKIPPLRR